MEEVVRSSVQWYSRGVRYKRLSYEEIMYASIIDIIKYGKEYNVKFESFNTTEDEVRNYKLPINVLEEYSSLMKKFKEDLSRTIVFDFFVSLIISWFIMASEKFFSYLVLLFFVPYFTHKYLYPKFKKEYESYYEKKFFKKYGIERNYNVENYVDEVMFQLYVRNRNVRETYGYR